MNTMEVVLVMMAVGFAGGFVGAWLLETFSEHQTLLAVLGYIGMISGMPVLFHVLPTNPLLASGLFVLYVLLGFLGLLLEAKLSSPPAPVTRTPPQPKEERIVTLEKLLAAGMPEDQDLAEDLAEIERRGAKARKDATALFERSVRDAQTKH